MKESADSLDRLDGSTYPPALTGMRGSHAGSFDAAHAIRDGERFSLDDLPVEEAYDLVVAGAGISGLAAAWFYRRRRPDDTILILDNHDDFGGHARRNEFVVGGRLLIGYGGSESLQSPGSLYGDVAIELLTTLGVDVHRFEQAFDSTLYPSLGLSRAVFFTREAFGVDTLVAGDPMRMVADDVPPDRMNARSLHEFVADFPLSAEAKEGLEELFTSQWDPLKNLSRRDKTAYLGKLSYRAYLVRWWDLSDEAANTFQGRPLDFFARGIDGISALEAMETGYPGFAGVGVEPSAEAAAVMTEPYIHHFPDGNASIARLMVRALIPAVASGRTMEDVVTARFDYEKLDELGAPTRLRLRGTVVYVRNRDAGVDIGYVRAGSLHRIRARRCVLAGYHMMIPSIMPELTAPQRKALRRNVKAPIVYVNAAVRDWKPWVRLGVHEITNPMGFFSRVKLDYPVSLGAYRCSRLPEEPILLHLVHVPAVSDLGMSAREEFRAAREILYAMTLEDFEAKVRDELTRMLGPGGFDADRDIAAITVNRWGHGYSYGGDPLFDRQTEGPRPFEIARARLGRVAFANSDAAWSAYAHIAIEQGHRAVGELLEGG